jgi:hypothetical protein
VQKQMGTLEEKLASLQERIHSGERLFTWQLQLPSDKNIIKTILIMQCQFLYDWQYPITFCFNCAVSVAIPILFAFAIYWIKLYPF